VLRRLHPGEDERLLIGADPGDDAAVWRLDDDRALVATVDVITPLVDDAHMWGRIAATNAASDVYAMGGRPLFSLNIVGWNRDELSLDLLSEVLEGAQAAAKAGGWVTAGGHTIDDPEPKFGCAVVGEVRLDRVLRADRLREGDELVLTKALGVGIASTAIKRGVAPDVTVEAAIASMTRLNDAAAAAAVAAGATGATDVTGFGLLGHLRRMAESSGVDVRIAAGAVPLFPGVADLAGKGLIPGGTRRNLAWVTDHLDADGVDDRDQLLLADAQTSGGLLFGVATDAVAVVAALRADGHDAAVVGRVTGRGDGRITVVRGGIDNHAGFSR
jgi:selenide,water dikinase